MYDKRLVDEVDYELRHNFNDDYEEYDKHLTEQLNFMNNINSRIGISNFEPFPTSVINNKRSILKELISDEKIFTVH